MDTKFEVNKAWIEEQVRMGSTIVNMADKLTELSGRKCSTNRVRAICKFYGINLRKKSNSYFVPVMESTVPVNNNIIIIDEQNNDTVAVTPGGIVEQIEVTQEHVNNYPDTFEQNQVGSMVTVETVTDPTIIDEFINGK